MESLRQVSPGGRVGTVFNTHWHTENTGANDVLRQGGATIVAHENTRLWMATPIWLPAEDRYRQPRPKTAHPNKTFRVDGSMNAGGERIDYGYLIEAHTSGDIYVFFRESNVLAVGDVASPARDPELDYLTGAWLGGRVDALTRLLALSNRHDADCARLRPGDEPRGAAGRARHDEDHLRPRGRSRTRGRQRRGHAQRGCPERAGPDVEAIPRTFLHAVHKGLWAHHNKLNPNVCVKEFRRSPRS